MLKLDSGSWNWIRISLNLPVSRHFWRVLRLHVAWNVIYQLPKYITRSFTWYTVYEHIPECTSIMNDIIVWGSTLQEQKQRLQQVFDALRKSNFKLNRERFELLRHLLYWFNKWQNHLHVTRFVFHYNESVTNILCPNIWILEYTDKVEFVWWYNHEKRSDCHSDYIAKADAYQNTHRSP